MSVPQVQLTARTHYLSLPNPLPLNGAIAIPSVLYRESGLRPGSQGVQSTEHGGVLNPRGAYGIASWNGPRQGDLKDFCDERGLSYDSLEAQLDFVLHEAANGYPVTWAAIRSSASLEAVVKTFVEDYERPKNPAAEIADAIRIARALAAVPVAVQRPPAATPQVPVPTVPRHVPSGPALGPGLPSMSSTSAGRISAGLEVLHQMRDARVAELAKGDPEVIACEAAIAALEGAAHTISIPPPTAIPATPTTQGNPIMQNVFGPNWKTTLYGLIAGAAQGVSAMYPQYAVIAQLTSGAAMVALGVSAKDFNTTGGTVAATPEAKSRV